MVARSAAPPTHGLEETGRWLADCVHCGFCLDACPTYVLDASEPDSPRGRILLIDQALAENGRISDEMADHFDSCLGCLACVTACPSGVRYDELIERVRPEVERQHERPAGERALRRLLFATLPHPSRLRALARTLPLAKATTRLLPDPLRTLVELAPNPPPTAPAQRRRERIPERTPPTGPARGRVALLLGCVQRVFFADVHHASIGALAADGFEVLAPAQPGCCGALELHAGELEAARRRAQRLVAAFGTLGELDRIVVNAAGCGAAMKRYGELLGTPEAEAFAARVTDISELLAEPRAPRGPVPLKVVYHDACHLRHAQGLREQPRAMLAAIPGLELLEVAAEADICCGSAGIYNLTQRANAARLGERKARHLLATGAELIAAGNPGCAAQLDAHLRSLGRPLPIRHPVELVWRSIQNAGP